MSAVLERAGLVTRSGQVVGVETPHPDAELLRMIAEFTQLNDTSSQLIRRAERLKRDGRACRKLWREVRSSHDERQRLEHAICVTKAITKLGIIAKANLCLETSADSTGPFWSLPRAALVEALAMLDAIGAAAHPDAVLLAACAEFDRLEVLNRAFDAGDTGSTAEGDALLDAQERLLLTMTGSAATLEGQVARARSLVAYAPDLLEDYVPDTIGCLLAAILGDLTGKRQGDQS